MNGGFNDAREFVEALVMRDETAWDVFQNEYVPYIYTIAKSVSAKLTHEDVEDVVMIVIDILLRSALESIRGDTFSELKGYIAKITFHTCINLLRRMNVINIVHGNEERDLLGNLAAQGPREGHFDDEATDRIFLQEAMSFLKDICRQILRLRFYEGHTQKVIARIVGIPEGTVASHLHRCLIEMLKITVTMSVEKERK